MARTARALSSMWEAGMRPSTEPRSYESGAWPPPRAPGEPGKQGLGGTWGEVLRKCGATPLSERDTALDVSTLGPGVSITVNPSMAKLDVEESVAISNETLGC